MPDSYLSISRAVVFVSALVYWAGVFIQAKRVRRRIRRSPNVKPRGTKEKLLWAGWFLVVLSWLTLPFLVKTHTSSLWIRIIPSLHGHVGFVSGILLMAAGYAGTLSCYAAMGNTWRMGINRAEKTTLVRHGPYRFVRHPIYLFQVVMLTGMALLLPVPLCLIILAVHIFCITVKATDEERYLRAIHGDDYEDYVSRSGRFLPKLSPGSK